MSGTAFLLANLGTPSAPTPQAVGRFLREFLCDPDVIPLPALLRYPLVHGLIVPRRREASAAKYRKIWTDRGSPLLLHSEALLLELRRLLGPRVFLGMRYGTPSLEQGFRQAMAVGAERIVLVPLYPQFAGATFGSTEKLFRRLAVRFGFREAIVFPPFPRAGFLIEALAAGIRPALGPRTHLLLSYHGLPLSQLRDGACTESESCCVRPEPSPCYRAHCLASSTALTAALSLPPERWTMGFQSRFGRARWIGPPTEALLRELPARGVTELVLATPSFLSDCLETLEEIGIEGRKIFLEAGGRSFRLIPCLNGDPLFARGLAAALEEFDQASR